MVLPDDATVAKAREELAAMGIELGEQIGAGAFGAVYEGRSEGLGVVAVKIALRDEKMTPYVEREVELQRQFRSPWVVRVHEVLKKDDYVCIVMERCEGTFDAWIRERTGKAERIHEKDVVGIFRNVLSALAELHARGIVHRDIKFENVLLARDKEGKLVGKLADFGLAKDGNILNTQVGTPMFQAPETKKEGLYDEKVDMYSVGIMMDILVEGENTVYQRVKRNATFRDLKKDQYNGYSREMINLMTRMLKPKPEDRPTALEALQHPFLGQVRCVEFVVLGLFERVHVVCDRPCVFTAQITLDRCEGAQTVGDIWKIALEQNAFLPPTEFLADMEFADMTFVRNGMILSDTTPIAAALNDEPTTSIYIVNKMFPFSGFPPPDLSKSILVRNLNTIQKMDLSGKDQQEQNRALKDLVEDIVDKGAQHYAALAHQFCVVKDFEEYLHEAVTGMWAAYKKKMDNILRKNSAILKKCGENLCVLAKLNVAPPAKRPRLFTRKKLVEAAGKIDKDDTDDAQAMYNGLVDETRACIERYGGIVEEFYRAAENIQLLVPMLMHTAHLLKAVSRLHTMLENQTGDAEDVAQLVRIGNEACAGIPPEAGEVQPVRF